jgi:hypothetical protein
MRKIGLKLDSLSVESFETAPASVGAGTVQGHQVSTRPLCVPTALCPTDYSCAVDRTDPASCQYGCDCTHIDSPC